MAQRVSESKTKVSGSSKTMHPSADGAIVDAQKDAISNLRGIRRKYPRGARINWTKVSTSYKMDGKMKCWSARVEGYCTPK
jgi:hypothetical protein